MTEAQFTQVDFDPFSGGEILLTAPVTEAQREIWLSVQLGDDANCAYNDSESLTLTGNLDIETLKSAIQQLVERHEALRITFTPDGEKYCVLSSLIIEIPLVDLTQMSEQDQIDQTKKILDNEVEQPFNLEHGPLIRAQIIKLKSNVHQLVLTIHHIVCDGWSWGVLIPELGILYSSGMQNLKANLVEADKFSEYAFSEQKRSTDKEEHYWSNQYADEIPALDLPKDHTYTSLRTFNSDRIDYEIDSDLYLQLKKYGAKNGCSLLNTLLAGFEIFLHRLTGQKDIVVGVATAGQSVIGKHHLVGHCVNILPLRTHVEGMQSFIDYLIKRRTAFYDALEHQQYSFGQLINRLNIQRDPSRIPLMPVVFNIDQEIQFERSSFGGLDIKISTNPRHYENFELFINVVQKVDQLTLQCQYNSNLFNAETIQNRLAEFETLLKGIVSDPDQPLSALPVLPENEKQLLTEWNATEQSYPKEVGIQQLIKQQTQKTPSNTAVVFEGHKLTYQELDQQANQLANYLKEKGIEPGKTIGICLERSHKMLIAVLGVLKAGCTYLPLDPAYPVERIHYMLEDSQTSIVLTESSTSEQIQVNTAKMVCIDTEWENVIRCSDANPEVQIKPGQLAYIIYTSGSTGKPKGVQVPHQSVINLLSSMVEKPGISEKDTLLAVITLSFDMSVYELFLPLIVGARIIIASHETASDGIQLAKLLDQSDVTILQATPITWQMMIEAGWKATKKLKVLCGGEPFPPDLVHQLVEQAAEVWNMYGPTETTVYSIIHPFSDPKDPVLIGHPIANTKIYILDQYQQQVPIGIPGEIYIGGDGVVTGYLNRPDLTEERFLRDPFSDDPHSRMYRTGDLARYLPDGSIKYHQRTDTQVKIRGFRIELGEIETALTEHDLIQQAVVSVREDVPGDKTLAAYIIPKETDNSADHSAPEEMNTNLISQLRDYLKVKLPDYMVPTHYMILPKLPLTQNGKVDRKALPAPDRKQIEKLEQYIPPRTATETQVAAIWSEVLRLDKISINHNFFELGGHSLLAIQIIIQLREKFDIELSLASLFETPTVESLAERIEVVNYVQHSSSAKPDSDEEYEEFEI